MYNIILNLELGKIKILKSLNISIVCCVICTVVYRVLDLDLILVYYHLKPPSVPYDVPILVVAPFRPSMPAGVTVVPISSYS